jgi:hypothetical protein
MLNLKKILVCFAATVLFSTASAGNKLPFENINLLVNPGFENALSEGWTLDWGFAAITKSVRNTGKKSLQVGPSAGGRAQVVNTGFAVGLTYTLLASGMLSDASGAGAQIGVICKDASDKKLGSFTSKNFTNSKEFEQQYVSFTMPENTTSIEVYAYYLGGKGTFFVDDFILAQGEAVVETEPAPVVENKSAGTTAAGLIANADFEKPLSVGWLLDWENSVITDKVKYSGANSLQAGPNAGGRAQVINQGFTAGSSYILSAWGMLGEGNSYGASIGVICKDAADKKIGSFASKNFASTSAFELKSVLFTIPAGTTSMEVYVYSLGGKALFYVDDLSLLEDK